MSQTIKNKIDLSIQFELNEIKKNAVMEFLMKILLLLLQKMDI